MIDSGPQFNVTLASNLPFSKADALRLKANALYGRDGEEKPSKKVLEEAAVLDPKEGWLIEKRTDETV